LTTLISSREIKQYARWSGVVRRRRKIDAVALFWAVVLGFSAGGERSLAGMRRAYEKATGTHLVPSAFYDRFTKSMAEFFHTVVGILLEKLQHKAPKMAGILEGFRDVLATDSTLVRLHELLERSYPASRTNHTKAAAKLHVVMSVKGAGTRRLASRGSHRRRKTQRRPREASPAGVRRGGRSSLPQTRLRQPAQRRTAATAVGGGP
jgi:hypothetical protein